MLYIDSFLSTLPIMGKGMAGIFLVTAVIVLSIAILNAVSGSSGEKKQ